MPWHDQRAFLDYMDQAEDIPLSMQEGGSELPPELAPQRRVADAGTDVIDLTAMRRELEAERDRLRGGG
jgi:hypothetical protein